jgi:ABC-type uncharacterized transport system substrate-binding protein
MRSILVLSFLALCATSLMAGDAAGAGKKILYVNAYHDGYAWSDGVQKGLKAVLTPSGAELKVFSMDTKNNPAKEFAEQKGKEAKALIDAWKPDVVVVSDDNPCAWIIKPFYKDAALPFVFCGVNWNGQVYGFPYTNTCGMYEIALVNECVAQLQKHAKGKRLTFLAADVETSQKDAVWLKKLVAEKGYELEARFATDFASWKAAYQDLQDKADMLILDQAGIKDWNKDEAVAFIEANTKIPSGCVIEYMPPYCLLGYSKISEEQGEWAAAAALQILSGKKPSEVGEATNKKAKIFFNPKLAKKLGIVPDVAFIKQAEIVK